MVEFKYEHRIWGVATFVKWLCVVRSCVCETVSVSVVCSLMVGSSVCVLCMYIYFKACGAICFLRVCV